MVKERKRHWNVLSILSIVFAIIYPVGLVLGIIALNQISRTGEKGKLLAWISILWPIGFLIMAFLTVVGI